MLDRYFFSEVSRISPEGPVPVALVKSERKTLGGAANVAHNLAQLGCRVSLVAVSGQDENENILLSKLNELSISVDGMLKVNDRPTTTKLRIIGGHQQMIRIDFENRERITPSHEKRILEFTNDRIPGLVDGVVLSDYAKGVCTTKICETVIQLCRRYDIPLVVDPKTAHWKKYKGAFLVTPNMKELGEVWNKSFANTDEAATRWGEKTKQRFLIDSLLVTRSEKGMSLIDGGKPAIHIPTYAREVFDVSGAGDTVAAVMGAALAAGASLCDAAHLSNLAAGVVVGKLGTYAISARELESALREYHCMEDTHI